MEAYNEFANLYDDLMNDVDYDMWFKYIKEIIEKENIKPDKVLEMACGTGNITEFLCKERFDITSFDLSEEMLMVAQQKLKAYRNLKMMRQDMTNFKFKDKYNLVLCTCDGMSYIRTQEDLKKVFENVYAHMTDDGVFVFDINSSYKIKEIIAKNTFVRDEEDVFYVWESEFDEETKLCEFYITFFQKEGELYSRFDEVHVQRAHEIDEIEKLLKEVGFTNIEIMEAFTFEEPNEKSERINFIVKK